MFINKIDNELLNTLEKTIKNAINSWYDIPSDLANNQYKLERIRFVHDWRKESNIAYIFEIHTEDNIYMELFSVEELNKTVEEYIKMYKEQNELFITFAKEILVNQFWYDYPVIWGTLDKTFDKKEDYQNDGKYASDDYVSFLKKSIHRKMKKTS